MKILFHAPALSVHRPSTALSHTLGVPPAVTNSLAGLREAHQLTGNRGNIIHAEAPARMLKKDPERSVVANLAKLQESWGEAFRERIAEHFDIIVISLANFIRPKSDGTRLFSALKALDGAVPFVVLGMGMQGTHEFSALMPGSRDLIALLNERAALWGVRGDKTAAWLQDNGFGNATVLGCPSMYVYPQSILSVDGAAARAKGKAANVLTAGHITIRNGGVVNRGHLIVKAFEGIEASYALQDEMFDYAGIAELPFSYNEGNNSADAEQVNAWLKEAHGIDARFSRYYYFSEAGAWRQGTLLHDVYIGDRFHGGVAALQAGQPAIFLKQDNRVSELTAHFDLPALATQRFAKIGLEAALEQFLSDEALNRMKATYRKRHDEFTTAMAGVGLELCSPLPAA